MNVREWALPIYTVLIQLSTGILFFLCFIRLYFRKRIKLQNVDQVFSPYTLVVFVTIVTAIVGAHFHLSKPFLSLYALRNIGTSWLSREILFTVLLFFSSLALWVSCQFSSHDEKRKTALGFLSIFFGLATVFCMTKIYLLPTQLLWNQPMTMVSYFSSVIILGAITVPTLMVMDLKYGELTENRFNEARNMILTRSYRLFSIIIAIMGLSSIITMIYFLVSMESLGDTARVSYQLITSLYAPLLVSRLLSMVIGIGFFIGIDIAVKRTGKNFQDFIMHSYTACLLIIISEITARFLFYATHVRIGI